MSLVALCSLGGGSPGVTTSAVALADRWPAGTQPVLVECDPAGGDLLARFRLPLAPGLASLAAAARRGSDAGLLWRHTQQLPGGLPVVVGPVGSEQAHTTLTEITGVGAPVLRRAADHRGVVVLADCGRLGPDSPALAVVRAADVVLIVARPLDDQLAHVAADLHLADRWSPGSCFLLLVGRGYSNDEVARTLEVAVLGRSPHDPAGAAIAAGRRRSRRGLSATALGRAAAHLAAATASHVRARETAPVAGAASRLALAPTPSYPVLPGPLAAESRNGERR